MFNDDKAAVGVFVMTSLKWNKYTVINVTFHHRMMLLLWALFTALQSQARYAFKRNAPMLLMRRWMFALSAWVECKKIVHVNLRETLGGCGCFCRKLLMDLHILAKTKGVAVICWNTEYSQCSQDVVSKIIRLWVYKHLNHTQLLS